jgi:hypothetical protein
VSRAQITARVLAAIILVVGCIYAGDYIVLRVRALHATPTVPFESLTRNRLLAIPMKNGKYEYELDEVNPTETLTCVHAIFPHSGAQPCWYLKPRLDKPIKIG